ncbi:hypothetical protein CO046_04520 [Candidatus Peregrinibacteria bacterium CG_4_9_14_0_2_um_filter_53_11]|nr:MAG: hypothetical protein CO046_04520 [Candidatus Peregrinibacteria bacterium CG_4_9_14_0_2_um_filter_53_11]
MKLLTRLSLLATLVVMLAGCQGAADLRDAILQRKDATVDKVNQVKDQVVKTKESVEQKIDDIDTAVNEVKEAIDAVKKVTDTESNGRRTTDADEGSGATGTAPNSPSLSLE